MKLIKKDEDPNTNNADDILDDEDDGANTKLNNNEGQAISNA